MHKIAISEEIIAGAIAQRGKLHRYDELVAARTALVVIDLQNVFMLPGMPVEVPAAREIVPNVNRLAAAMRAAGGSGRLGANDAGRSDRELECVFRG